VLNPEGRGQVFLQIHPDFRTAELEQEMIAVAEQHLTTTDKNAKLWVWADSQDNMRQAILTRRGFHKVDWADQHEYQRRRSLDAPILEAPPALGYTVRSLGDGLELLERCYTSGLAFHENDIKIAVENRDDPTWYRNIQNAPLYRRDLDLVAIAPDGAVASFCTIWFDDVTRTAYFEPVATAPTHQRRGLGKAVMCEGLRRLKRMGAISAFVGSYEPPAHALYTSVGFTEYDLIEPWAKE
jgi:mycothiol synthase